MDSLKTLEIKIPELMGLHPCVTVPGLGSFIYRESPATANNFTWELKPATGSVFFNNAITADDGILVNALRESEGYNYAQALEHIKSAVQIIRERLEQKRNLGFGSLGNFFLNAENQVFFLPSPHLNLSHQSFGLPVIKLEELSKQAAPAPVIPTPQEKKEEKEIVSAPTEYEEAEVIHISEEQTRRSYGWIWKAASVAAIAILGATGIYYGSRYLGSDEQHAQAKLASPAVELQTEEVPAAVVDTVLSQKSETESLPENTSEVISENTTVAEQDVVTGTTEDRATTILTPELCLDELRNNGGRYFVTGGMYMDEGLAHLEVAQWNQNGISAAVYKQEGSSLFKVIFKRFENEKEASEWAAGLPVISGTSVAVKTLKFK